MCNDYRYRQPHEVLVEEFAQLKIPLVFPGGIPNIPPRDDIRISDSAPIVTRAADGVQLTNTKWAWKSPQGRPVFNFRSDGRSFDGSTRCLIPADGFYEFTDPEPGQKLKTKWLFTLTNEPWFWIAGIVKQEAFAMLTTEPGPDIASYHDRQIVVLPRARGMEWLNLTRPEPEILKALPATSLSVAKVFPPESMIDRPQLL